MNVSAVVVSTLLAGMSAPAAVPVVGKVKICLHTGSAPLFLVGQAESKATGIFGDIGIKLEWLHSRRDCQIPPPDTIVITMSVDSPATLLPGALAYAMPYEGAHIEVFYDRLSRITEQRRQPALLAHVLAHELAHILEGVKRHSDDGLMKASWSEYDFMQMSLKPLHFAPLDVQLIQFGVEVRTSRIAKAN